MRKTPTSSTTSSSTSAPTSSKPSATTESPRTKLASVFTTRSTTLSAMMRKSEPSTSRRSTAALALPRLRPFTSLELSTVNSPWPIKFLRIPENSTSVLRPLPLTSPSRAIDCMAWIFRKKGEETGKGNSTVNAEDTKIKRILFDKRVRKWVFKILCQFGDSRLQIVQWTRCLKMQMRLQNWNLSVFQQVLASSHFFGWKQRENIAVVEDTLFRDDKFQLGVIYNIEQHKINEFQKPFETKIRVLTKNAEHSTMHVF